MAKHFFKEGDMVRHKDCLDLSMTIARILKERREFIDGFDKDRQPIKKIGTRMIGIECHWFIKNAISDSELRIHKFHSTELVPEDIAIKGREEVDKWLIEQLNK